MVHQFRCGHPKLKKKIDEGQSPKKKNRLCQWVCTKGLGLSETQRMMRWCVDALMRWYGDAVMRWCGDTVIRWYGDMLWETDLCTDKIWHLHAAWQQSQRCAQQTLGHSTAVVLASVLHETQPTASWRHFVTLSNTLSQMSKSQLHPSVYPRTEFWRQISSTDWTEVFLFC